MSYDTGFRGRLWRNIQDSQISLKWNMKSVKGNGRKSARAASPCSAAAPPVLAQLLLSPISSLNMHNWNFWDREYVVKSKNHLFTAAMPLCWELCPKPKPTSVSSWKTDCLSSFKKKKSKHSHHFTPSASKGLTTFSCFSLSFVLTDIITLRFGPTKCQRPARRTLWPYWSGWKWKTGCWEPQRYTAKEELSFIL